MSETAHGPIDYLVLEFSTDLADGSMSAALLDLVDSATIRILDLAVISRTEDGSVIALDVNDTGFSLFVGASSGLLDDEDLQEAGQILEPGRSAAVLVYENAWAAPFVAAARAAGAEVVASARIPADVVTETLDLLAG